MSNCNSQAISDCKQIKAFIDCIPTITQGETRSINIQLLNEDNTYLDLSLIEEIRMVVYDERNESLGEFMWPFHSAYKDIYIMQEEYTDDILNMGLINVEIDSDITLNAMSGGLYAEIKLSSNLNTFGSDDKFIGCLVLGKIKTSMMNRFETISDMKNPDNWEENRVI